MSLRLLFSLQTEMHSSVTMKPECLAIEKGLLDELFDELFDELAVDS